MYQKECKWCNELIIVKRQQNFASHIACCKMNPNFELRKKEQSERLKGVLKSERITLNKECLKCGSIFEIVATEKQISNNKTKSYCNRSCANSRIHSEKTIEKISQTLKISEKRYQPDNNGRKYKTRNSKILDTNRVNEFTCLKCGNKGIDERYNNQRQYHKECWLSISGGIKKGSSRGKCGWYKGYWCDSSYELAYLIYNLEHDIEIKRNKEGFEYIYNNEKHLFYPDFIVDSKYVEIKNFKSDLTDSKLSYFPYDIDIYYKDTIIPYLLYVKSKYGKDFTKLYENIVKIDI